MDYIAEIAEERTELALLLETLDDEQLAVQSLCTQWTVRDVFAHLLMPLVTPPPRYILSMVRNRMNFDKANVDLTARTAQRDTDEIAQGLMDQAANTFTPPGLGPQAPLTDCLVHGQDIRRPLGIDRDFPHRRLRAVLDFLTGGKARGFTTPARYAGLALRAIDLDWSFGEGDEVTGPGEAIMMALVARPVALQDLTGPGLVQLRQRMN